MPHSGFPTGPKLFILPHESRDGDIRRGRLDQLHLNPRRMEHVVLRGRRAGLTSTPQQQRLRGSSVLVRRVAFIFAEITLILGHDLSLGGGKVGCQTDEKGG